MRGRCSATGRTTCSSSRRRTGWGGERPRCGPPRLAAPRRSQVGWFDTEYLGIDQTPILLMTENARPPFVWRLRRAIASLTRGLGRAGYSGGWLAGRRS
ncbi:MAG TPA: glucoamylase family protein [Gemmatimonadaceae bacterium]|nr:glucoamylase family protein [Gemmatimonadaceae bacterium]